MENGFLDFDQYEIPVSIDVESQSIPDTVKLISICEKEDGSTNHKLLNKILSSIGDSSLTHTILLDASEMIRISELNLNNNGFVVLAFGISPKRLGLNINVGGYQLIKTDNDIAFVFTHKLDKINEDKTKKLRLWNILKELT